MGVRFIAALLLVAAFTLAAAQKTPNWVYNFPTPQAATNPVVFFDLVFVPTNTTLYAIRLQDGVVAWSFSYPNNDVGGYVAADTQYVFVGCYNALYALSLNGQLQWQYTAPVPRPTPFTHLRPSIAKSGALYVTTGYSPLAKISQTNGSLVWMADPSLGAAQLHATEFNQLVYVISVAGGISYAVCLDATTAALQWNISGMVTLIVAQEAGLLFAQGGNSTASLLYANELSVEGNFVYQLVYSGMQSLDYYVLGNTLYVDIGPTQAPYPTSINKYDARTGEQMWSTQGVSFLFFIPCSKGIVNFGPQAASGYDKDTGALMWTYPGVAVNDGAATFDKVIMITSTSVVSLTF